MNLKQKPKNPIVVVVGVPGSGKSLILSAVKAQERSINVLNYGKEMLSVAGKAEEERDQMRQLSPSRQADMGRLAAESIVAQANAKVGTTTIVDTHALIKTPHGFVPGLPFSVLQIVQPRALCVVEASPEFVLKYRKADKSRFREKVSIDDIGRHQELTRHFAVSCAALSGCVVQFVNNEGQEPGEIAKPLLELIQFLKGV